MSERNGDPPPPFVANIAIGRSAAPHIHGA